MTQVTPGFGGRRVLTLESRRAPELATLVTTYGGQPVVAPALREVPLESNLEAQAFTDVAIRGEVDVVILLTGVGTRALMQLAEPRHGRRAFVQALTQRALVARGPKPVAVLREYGLAPTLVAPPPHTSQEVLAILDQQVDLVPLRGARVAVQEYGAATPDLARALETRGAFVSTVPVYRWQLPADERPLRDAIRMLAGGGVDVVLLTSGVQVQHLLRLAADMGCDDAVRAGLRSAVIASIGPATSEELRRHGLAPDLEPSSARMGVLVREAAERCDRLASAKRAGHPDARPE